MILLPLQADDVDLAGGWDAVWKAVEGAAPNITNVLNTVGVILLVLAISKYLWDRRSGQGGNTSGLLWTAIVGVALAAPGFIFPTALRAFDFAANTFIRVFF